ncbi:AmmeMemoRadiSam system protein B [uncultured Sphaerochaeta sp.]|uniref:AmmeMemoRadiSam system protein B n=1 Tax=uncultured Sphaerochaeta sp. TaxID=886478 RepID=UPI002A0A1FED|nr:AmmeMemoRadiSam system protein B [uncultured Sphaerochaeta sp.]
MSMLDSYHHMIFYPEDQETLSLATAKREAEVYLRSLPSAILVPHAAYQFSLEALHRSFSVAGHLKPSLIVFLGPLHQEVLEADAPSFLFTSSMDGISIAGVEHRFANTLIKELTASHAPFFAQEDSYLVEEPALELTLPMIHSYFPDVPVLPILASSCTSEQIQTYQKVLESVVEKEKNVLFIVSSNANALLSSPQAEEDARTFISRLSTGVSLLENRRGERISSCNSSSLEALRRLTVLSGNWTMNGYFGKQGEQPEIKDYNDMKEKHVWHISAYQGETNA